MPKIKDPICLKQKRLTVYIPEIWDRKLRSKLALEGKNVSNWLREVVKEIIKD